MLKGKGKSLPQFKSLSELVDFFDHHDMGPYLERLPEVHFDVELERMARTLRLDGKLDRQLKKLAKTRKMSPERLITRWIKEKVVGAGRPKKAAR